MMSNSDKTVLLNRLSQRVAALPNRPARGELLSRAMDIPLAWPDYELPANRPLNKQFKEALMPWGATVHLVETHVEAEDKIRAVFEQTQAKKASRWNCERLNQLDWAKIESDLTIEWDIPTDAELASAKDEAEKVVLKNRLEKIELGIMDCDLAVAHTGTLIVRHGSHRNGYINLFPWTLIAVVWGDQLVRDLQSATERLTSELSDIPLPSNLTFITGPSRSADIDLTVGQGAAGPGRMDIIVIGG